jgi:hypothetical protein
VIRSAARSTIDCRSTLSSPLLSDSSRGMPSSHPVSGPECASIRSSSVARDGSNATLFTRTPIFRRAVSTHRGGNAASQTRSLPSTRGGDSAVTRSFTVSTISLRSTAIVVSARNPCTW